MAKNNKKAKQKKQQEKPSYSAALGFKSFFENEKTNFTAGIILLAFAVYITIAFVSFLSTGAMDQSIVEHPLVGDLANVNRDFHNYCGSIGAYISFFLIGDCFGYPAFLIPLFLGFAALRMMDVYSVNLWKWFFGSALAMVWSSITCAMFLAPILSNQIFNAGGKHGAYVCQFFENVIGAPGLTAILALTAIIFLTFISSETITFIRKCLNPVGYITSKVTFNFHMPKNNNEATEGVESQMAGFEEAQEDEEPASENVVENTTIDLTDMEGGAATTTAAAAASAGDDDIVVTNPDKEPDFNVTQAVNEEKAAGKTPTVEEIMATPINPKEPFTNYKYPTLDLLKKYDDNQTYTTKEELLANKNRITEVLHSFGVEIRAITATVGPTITLYEITPAEGVRISKIRNLEDDIALSLSALGIRIIAPIPGKGTIGIEVPNSKATIVSMESVLNSRKFQETKMELPLCLGKTITNEVFMVDLAKIPHLLVAGATGQGKSVGLNAMISSLLYKKHPNELKIVLVDPKKVEFSIYEPIADHFMAQVEDADDPIITDVTKVVKTLKSICALMDHRYDLLKMANVRNIKEYNEKYINHRLRLTDGHEYMPYVVVVIDEFGDLIMTAGKEVELPIARIAQLARAVGIHMIIATQRPTTNIITGTIKANFPGRVAFRVGAGVDSKTILDRTGANQLIGKGDMLYLNGNEPVRVQCAFLDTPEVESLTQFIHEQPGPIEPLILPEPIEEGGGDSVSPMTDTGSWDPLFEQAAVSIVNTQQGSTSMIQRQFSIGYNRAGRLMDQLEKAGIVGAAHGSKPREVLYADENAVRNHIAALRGGAIG